MKVTQLGAGPAVVLVASAVTGTMPLVRLPLPRKHRSPVMPTDDTVLLKSDTSHRSTDPLPTNMRNLSNRPVPNAVRLVYGW